MMGPSKRRAGKLFYTAFDLDDRVPADHPLRRIRQRIDFDAVRQHVASCYGDCGHVSLDPALIMKLMFLAFYDNVRSERELMRQLPMRLDWLWFLELDLDDDIPNHSVTSKARRRWGREVFETLFTQVLQQCVDAGLVSDEAWHADSTLLRANASVDSRISRKLWEQLERGLPMQGEASSGTREPAGVASALPSPASDVVKTAENLQKGVDRDDDQRDEDDPPPALRLDDTSPGVAPPQAPQAPQGQFNRLSVSTTDPDAATTRRRGRGVTLGYRDHRLVDDAFGVIINTTAMPADYDDGVMLTPMLDQSRNRLHRLPKRVTGDSAYGTQANYASTQAMNIRGYLKPRPGRNGGGKWHERLPSNCAVGAARHWLRRRLSVAEGSFAQAHTRHDHRRCRWRGLANVQIQCDLVGLVQNVAKLLRHGQRPRPAASAGVLRRLWRRLLPCATARPAATRLATS